MCKRTQRDVSTPSSATVGSVFAARHSRSERSHAGAADGRFPGCSPAIWRGLCSFEIGHRRARSAVPIAGTWELQQADGGRLTIAGGFERGALRHRLCCRLAPASIARSMDLCRRRPAARPPIAREARVVFDFRHGAATLLEFGLTARPLDIVAHQIDTSPRAELVDGIPARVWVPQRRRAIPAEPRTTSRRIAADHFTAADHLTIRPRRCVRPVQRRPPPEATKSAWNALLPRAAFRWSPAIGTLYGGGGRYQSELPARFVGVRRSW